MISRGVFLAWRDVTGDDFEDDASKRRRLMTAVGDEGARLWWVVASRLEDGERKNAP